MALDHLNGTSSVRLNFHVRSLIKISTSPNFCPNLRRNQVAESVKIGSDAAVRFRFHQLTGDYTNSVELDLSVAHRGSQCQTTLTKNLYVT